VVIGVGTTAWVRALAAGIAGARDPVTCCKAIDVRGPLLWPSPGGRPRFDVCET
jgi:hypothetical protein